MEMEDKKQPLGGGIITVSVLYIIGTIIILISTIISFYTKDATNKILADGGIAQKITNSDLIIGAVFAIIALISVILILLRNTVGIYLFFGIKVLNVVYSIVTAEMSIFIAVGLLVGLILPILMGVFIYNKRDIYGFKKELI